MDEIEQQHIEILQGEANVAFAQAALDLEQSATRLARSALVMLAKYPHSQDAPSWVEDVSKCLDDLVQTDRDLWQLGFRKRPRGRPRGLPGEATWEDLMGSMDRIDSRGHPVTIASLAKDLGVGPRTVQRALAIHGLRLRPGRRPELN